MRKSRITPYQVTNNLNTLINDIKEMSGLKKYVIVDEIAQYCGLTSESIKKMSENRIQPSLPVAFKLAQYFEIGIEALFTFHDAPVEVSDAFKCTQSGCDLVATARGLCRKHYNEIYQNARKKD
ncbi:HTH DNA binding protein [Bacillus phage CAM003]|uniref:Uncharacterized protein n=3 Tax=Bastillevirus TaxID=1918010 RepID=A0A024B1D3_9CAUD|nr:HTH DNA binding protein [Bacillus phage Hoody T]YP_009035793.1 HTH DNA binding protein [Bacillus phage Evoli]YP_009037168.1 HTH DNA binding protein [Bacillus phage CAM003]AHZ09702.1 helix-turn-helix binding domain protein [Bacillus phage CAM003]AHZ09996.1 hypothetical protein [Bacillus phage Evoli]AHZ10563.1 helix-turn-helix binding domain protein [Bacillus phage Hoody T]